MATTLYIARAREGGRTFTAVDVLPILARSRLALGIAEFKGADSDTVAELVNAAEIETVTPGTFRAS